MPSLPQRERALKPYCKPAPTHGQIPPFIRGREDDSRFPTPGDARHDAHTRERTNSLVLKFLNTVTYN
jgi:hypothetical protein